MKIKIYYLSGAGNMFLVFKDPKTVDIDLIVNKIINTFRSKLTIEGIMSISEDHECDFDVKYYNPDGSTGMMCGNGGRCAVQFAKFSNIINSDSIETKFSMSGNVYNASFSDKGVKLYFDLPKKELKNQILEIDKESINYDFFDVGTEHVCIDFTSLQSSEDIDSFNLEKFSLPIRHNHKFAPIGVNVNLYQIKSEKLILLRTFEKGVEAETGACGTGAISTALSASDKSPISFPVEIIPPSKKSLWVDKTLEKIILEGPAEVIKEYDLELEDER